MIRSKMLYLPKRQGYENKKTVIFDLDETLVHCCGGPNQGEVPISISFPSGE